MLTIKAMTGGDTYADRHLSNNDYYAVGVTVPGQWMGRGAMLLGLQGKVTRDQFDAIRQGLDPSTGNFLRPRHSANKFDAAGKQIARARNLYDFTISAPKALSVQALVDPRLRDAHDIAVAETAKEIESLAAAQVRKHGASGNRPTSNLLLARYRHDTSRELDPQIHTHLVAGNLTYDGVEGTWKALQACGIYEQREYLSEVYRNAAAREVTRWGIRSKTASSMVRISASALPASRNRHSKSTARGARSGIKPLRSFCTKTGGCPRTMKSVASFEIRGIRN